MLAAGLFALYPRWIVDDAYISYRYGANLAVHGELNWNPGEDPVEGYTGVMLPLVAAMLVKAGLPVAGSVQVMSMCIWLLSLLALNRLLHRMKVGDAMRRAALLAYTLSPIAFMHALSGLETLWFTAALLAVGSALVQCLQNARSTGRDVIELGLWALAAALIRPEGAWAGSVACVLAIAASDRDARGGRLLWLALLFVIPFVLYFLCRWNYYGRFLPNTFYAKYSSAGVEWESVKDLIRFGLKYWAAGAVVVLLSWWWQRPSWKAQAVPRNYLLFCLALWLPVMAVYVQSQLWMNYSHRLWLPFAPLFIPIAARAAETCMAHLQPAARLVLGIAFMLAQGTSWAWQHRLDLQFLEEYAPIVREELEPAGRLLGRTVPQGQWIVSYQDAGAVAWFSGLPVVDFGHLNSEALTAPHLSMKEKAALFYGRKPAALVLTSYDSVQVHYLEELDSLLADPRFDNYSFFAKFRSLSPLHYFQFIYLRRDLIPPARDRVMTE